MFNKLSKTWSNDDNKASTNSSRGTSSMHSNEGGLDWQLSAIDKHRSSVDSDNLPPYRSRSTSTIYGPNTRSQSTPGNSNGQENMLHMSPRPNAPQSRRRRNMFWKSSLWNSKHRSPRGSRVRASSQSVTLPHPSVVEEQMRNMPHHDWRGRNKPDGVWDNANLARLYW